MIYGRNPIMEALKSGREIEKLILIKNGEGSLKKIEGLARARKIPIQYVEKSALDRLAQEENTTVNHQGAAAVVSAYEYCGVEDLFCKARQKGEPPFFIILDGIEDPHNLGAILRSADGAGAHGVIIPKRRNAGLTETVAKSSAGAIEYVPVARVSNLAQTIEKLKEAGLWIGVCDMDGQTYWKADLTGPIAIVIGSEGKGVSRLVRERSDFVVSMPMEGRINSLNASNAAAILLYEINRQRKIKE